MIMLERGGIKQEAVHGHLLKSRRNEPINYSIFHFRLLSRIFDFIRILEKYSFCQYIDPSQKSELLCAVIDTKPTNGEKIQEGTTVKPPHTNRKERKITIG